MEEARRRCRNGCRNTTLNGTPATCLRCEDAAALAWEMVLRDREGRDA